MISFKQFLIESSAGNYVSIGVKEPFVIPVLEKIFGGSHVCEPEDQHVTLIYSKGTDVKESKILDCLHHWDSVEDVKLGEVAAFDSVPKEGERDEKLCTIVIKLESNVLQEIHSRLKEIGLKHSYPDFSPHISLLYNLPIEQKKRAIETIEDFLKENRSVVTLSGYHVNPIIENWADKK